MRLKKLLAAAVMAAMAAMMVVVPASAEELPTTIPDEDGLTLTSGTYDLVGDTTISGILRTAADANVIINLNGYTLTSTRSSGYHFNINAANSSLTIIGKGTVQNTGTPNGISASGNITIKDANVGKMTLSSNATCDATFENVTFNDTAGLNAKGSFSLVNCKAAEGILINTANNTTTITGADTEIDKLAANSSSNITISDGVINELSINAATANVIVEGGTLGVSIGSNFGGSKLLTTGEAEAGESGAKLLIKGGTFTNNEITYREVTYDLSQNTADGVVLAKDANGVWTATSDGNKITYAFENTNNLPVNSSLESGEYGANQTVTLSTSREAFAKEAPQYVFYGWNVTVDTSTTTYDGYEATITLEADTAVSPNAPWAFDRAEAVTPVDNVYTISTPQQLAWISQQAAGGNSFEGCTIQLADNIDLSGRAWYPIGNETNPFKGTFDGGNYTISNMTCNSIYSGVIGYMNGGTVQNLNVTGADVYAVTTDTQHSSAGCVVGDATNSTVSNCTVANSTVQTDGLRSFYGGIVGRGTNTKITDCSVTGLTTVGTWKTGGIVGYLVGGEIDSVSVTNSTLRGGTGSEIGLIVGHAQHTVSVINAKASDCTAYCRDTDGNDEQIQNAIVGTAYSSNDNSTLTIGGNDTNITTDIIRYSSSSDSALVLDGGSYDIELEALAGTDIAYKETGDGSYNLVTVGSTQADLDGYRTVSGLSTYSQMYVFEKTLASTNNTVGFMISNGTNNEAESVTFDIPANVESVTKIGLIITDIPNDVTVTVTEQ